MPRQKNEATLAALAEYKAAPRGKKPSDIVLGAKHGISPSTVYRARMSRKGKKKEAGHA